MNITVYFEKLKFPPLVCWELSLVWNQSQLLQSCTDKDCDYYRYCFASLSQVSALWSWKTSNSATETWLFFCIPGPPPRTEPCSPRAIHEVMMMIMKWDKVVNCRHVHVSQSVASMMSGSEYNKQSIGCNALAAQIGVMSGSSVQEKCKGECLRALISTYAQLVIGFGVTSGSWAKSYLMCAVGIG